MLRSMPMWNCCRCCCCRDVEVEEREREREVGGSRKLCKVPSVPQLSIDSSRTRFPALRSGRGLAQGRVSYMLVCSCSRVGCVMVCDSLHRLEDRQFSYYFAPTKSVFNLLLAAASVPSLPHCPPFRVYHPPRPPQHGSLPLPFDV